MVKNRKKKSKLNLILFIAFLAALIGTVIIALLAYEENEVYRNESQFYKFVEYRHEADGLYGLTSIDEMEYSYGKPISYAIDYSGYQDEEIVAFRDEQINNIKESYTKSVSGDDQRVRALLISSDIYEADNGSVSLILHESSSVENNKTMNPGHSSIYTYQFSKKTGDRLVPQQVFYEDYKEYCYQYFSDFFIKNYEEELLDGWQEYIMPNEKNFNEFTLTETGVVFFFEEGTVLEESEGVIYAGLTGIQASDILREKIIERYIDPNKPMVALTYDDGPGGEAEERILDCLEENNAVATFFYQGVFIEGREDKIIRAKELGCEIGHHTWSHPELTSLEKKEVKKQLDKTNKAIYEACGTYPTVFRPSYGLTDKNINKLSKMPVIMWSVDTLDWESRNGRKVFNMVKKSGNLDGDIILLHSIHDSTADATELLVPWLKKRGYQLVTVSELIKYKTGKDPVDGKVYYTYK